MRVNPVNFTNFKGVYKEVIKENGEKDYFYRPYSWELIQKGFLGNNAMYYAKGSNCDYIEPYSVYDDFLPNNELKSIDLSDRENHLTGYTDVFGTVVDYPASYSKIRPSHYDTMNREESLEVYSDKMKAFLMEKRAQLKNFEEKQRKINLVNDEELYSSFSKFVPGLSYTPFYKNFAKNIQITESNIYNSANIVRSYFKTEDKIFNMEKEIKLLREARLQGKLIDISNRSVEDPNKPAWEYVNGFIQDIYEGSEPKKVQELNVYNKTNYTDKVLALPHKTVLMKDFLKEVLEARSYKSFYYNPQETVKNLPKYVVEHIDYIICHRL